MRGATLVLAAIISLAFMIPVAQAAWVSEVIDSSQVSDSTGHVGTFTSLTFDQYGDPHVSYYDFTTHHLKHAFTDGGMWFRETADATGDVGQYSSIAFDPGSHLLGISYFDATNWELKYVAETVGVSGYIGPETVDSGGAGQYTSIAFDAGGNPHISYYDATNFHLKYASKSSTGWSVETADPAPSVGKSTSLALDSGGNPRISYFDFANGHLKYASKSGTGWSIETVDPDPLTGSATSIALDSAGNPHIAYWDAWQGRLKYASESNEGAWSIEVVDPGPYVGDYASLALDSAGNPHISYSDEVNGRLKYASKSSTGWSIETVDSPPSPEVVGAYTSLALDPAGNPHISYYDGTYGRLKYASPPGEIHGMAWDDVDRNGQKDTGEAGMPDVKVCATYNNSATSLYGCTTTASDGSYSFTNLPPEGWGLVVELSPDEGQTYPAATEGWVHGVTLHSNEVVNGMDFGIYSIAPPPADVTVVQQTGTVDVAPGISVPKVSPSIPTLTLQKKPAVTDITAATVTVDWSDSTSNTYTMSRIDSTTWGVDIPPVYTSGSQTYPAGIAHMRFDFTSSSSGTIIEVGDIDFYDPSGQVLDACTRAPLDGALVTIKVLDPSTGFFNVAGENKIYPAENPQTTQRLGALDGAYSWYASGGTYYVEAAMAGYQTVDTPPFSVPPEITGLDILLTPDGGCGDTLPPATTIAFAGARGQNGWYVSDVTVTLSATDNPGGSGIITTQYSLDGGTTWIAANPFTITTEGTSTVSYYSTDRAGNAEGTKTATVSVDKTPPGITLSSPQAGAEYALNRQVSAVYTVLDPVSGPASVKGSDSASPVPIASMNPLPTGIPGAHTFTVTATDVAGNTGTQTAGYLVFIPAKVFMYPRILNLAGKGSFIAFVKLPDGYLASDVDKTSVQCSGETAKRVIGSGLSPHTFGAIFRTSELQGVFPGDQTTLTIQGYLKNKLKFEGSDTVKVIRKTGASTSEIPDWAAPRDADLFRKYPGD